MLLHFYNIVHCCQNNFPTQSAENFFLIFSMSFFGKHWKWSCYNIKKEKYQKKSAPNILVTTLFHKYNIVLGFSVSLLIHTYNVCDFFVYIFASEACSKILLFLFLRFHRFHVPWSQHLLFPRTLTENLSFYFSLIDWHLYFCEFYDKHTYTHTQGLNNNVDY